MDDVIYTGISKPALDDLLRLAGIAAEDLACEVSDRYRTTLEYPTQRRRHDNDMEAVTNLQAAIEAVKSETARPFT